MDSLAISEAPVDDIFRILIATDTHLGYAEEDAERCNDSFVAFEEVLRLARAHEVDFLLLGGDLFHETRPSTQCLHKCLELLRQYCLGDKPISVEFLSDQKVNFQHCAQPVVNYYDPYLSVSIPVFSIHGNHDDPTGQKQLSSLDILSTSGLVNYFGKWTDLTEVKINPILLRKGNSKLALYGLSHIKDERLSRLFRDGKVQWFRPDEDTEDWFNIFVCHQNREERGIAKFLPEESLPAFLDLVIWGHEHECRLEDERRLELRWNQEREFYVMQPGSSVATSLCPGEAELKHVALLNVCKRKFKLETLRLKTVRPFVCESVILSECNLPELGDTTSAKVQDYLEERINFWIEESKKQLTGHEKQPTLPLIRVRVEYKEEEEAFNTIRFGQRFHSRVANPSDVVLLKKHKRATKKIRKDNREQRAEFDELLDNESGEDWESKINHYMVRYFDEVSRKKMEILSLRGMNDAVASFVEKNDKEKFKMILEHQMKKVCKHLCDNKIDVEKINEEIENYRIQRMHAGDEEEREELEKLKNNDGIVLSRPEEEPTIEDDDDLENGDGDGVNQPVPATQRGRARGGRARGRATTTRATTTRARGRARGTRAGAASASSTRANTSAASPRQSSRTTQRTLTQTRLMYDDEDEDDF